MDLDVRSKRLHIRGMTCINCQNKIERRLRKTAGIRSVKVSFSAGTADITWDTDMISMKDIVAVIRKLDYEVSTGDVLPEQDVRRVVGILVIILSLYLLLQQSGILNLLVPGRLADTKMGYGMMFVIGLITSVHCIAMCGGINLSQSIPKGDVEEKKKGRVALFRSTFLYNMGRVISYTVIGLILGFVGMLFGGGSDAGLPVMFQGILKLFAGVFMVLMGINMLSLFPWFRKLQPAMPKFLAGRAGEKKKNSKSPLLVGLLNGLMPCGPLQSMQIVAVASGNPLTGALSMFLFSAGTVPLMLGLGSVVSALGKKFTTKVMYIGAVLVVVLGLAMLSQGGSLSGFLPPDVLFPFVVVLCVAGVISRLPFRRPLFKTISAVAALAVAVIFVSLSVFGGLDANGGGNAIGSGAPTGAASSGDYTDPGDYGDPADYGDPSDPGDSGEIQIENGRQIIHSTLASGRYPDITVQAGTPVRWVIDAPKGSINGCNNRMFIQEYGVEHAFQTGENIIEFTPTRTGNVGYSCWMGMIRGNITVVETG